MIPDLRKKFVMVTTTLMLVTFGTLVLVNHIYSNYWSRVELADTLDLIADSGYFFYDTKSDVEKTIINITEGTSPIAGIVVNKNGEVLSYKVIGKKNGLHIPERIIQRILEAGNNSYQIERYLYAKRSMENGRTLIVIMDTSIDDNFMQKLIGITCIVASGFFALILITFYLSKFVTRPAKEALQREKRFISDASHELKTPLGAISINAQALHTAYPDNLYVRNILLESGRMGRLIEKLLTLSKLNEEEACFQKRMSLSDITTEMALTYESMAFEKKLHYEYKIDEDLYINGDEDEIRQLIAILIDNAVKNTDPDGQIHLGCTHKGRMARIEIENTGAGIAPKDLPHVFERFYTSNASRSNKSFGLGLAIAKTIVERHKGTIHVHSIPGERTVFSVSFHTVS